MLRFLRERNRDAQIIALAVLPRGWTDAWHVYDWPSMYKLGIDVINRALKDFAAQDDAAHYLDCGQAVTPGGQVRLRQLPPCAAPLSLCSCTAANTAALLFQSGTLLLPSKWASDTQAVSALLGTRDLL